MLNEKMNEKYNLVILCVCSAAIPIANAIIFNALSF